MAVSPTVDEVQHAVMQAWITACITASPPPAVLDSLVFFHPQHGFTPIAIVDVHGENFYRCGRYTVRTVHHQTPLARQMSDCRIGECISHGGAPILLVARDGGPLADPDTCRQAEAESVGNLKRVSTGGGRMVDWNEGPWAPEALRQRAVEIKNVWVPYGD